MDMIGSTAGEQRTDEWDAIRLGKVTASNVKRVLPGKSGKYLSDREDYKVELITERLTGIRMPMFQSDAMKWGTAQEPSARDAFAKKMNLVVNQVMFVEHPSIRNCGVSPDGLVTSGGEMSNVEIKCPHTKTHIETIIRGTADPDYYPQMTLQMGACKTKKNYFVSYDPRLPEDMQLVIHEYNLDVAYLAMIEDEIRKFLSELESDVDKILERFPQYRQSYILQWRAPK